MPSFRQIEVAEELKKSLRTLPLCSEPMYTKDFWHLDGYTAGGLTVAIDFEYTSTDDEYPEPQPVFLLFSSRDAMPCVVPFGKNQSLDDRVRYAIRGFYASHQLAVRAEGARFS